MLPATYIVNGTEYKIQYPSGDVAYWNKKARGTNNNDSAGLQYWLNDGNDVETKSPKDGYMSYLSQSAKTMIEDAKYYLGMVTFQYINAINFGIIDNSKDAYMNERTVNGCVDNKGPIENKGENLKFENPQNCRVWSNNFATWSGNIALLYSSDYGYSANSKYWNTKLDYPTFNETASDSSWLQKGANHESTEWLLSATTFSTIRVARWSDSFIGSYNVDDDFDLNTIRPCLYLKSNVKITNGTGEESNPYKLSIA